MPLLPALHTHMQSSLAFVVLACVAAIVEIEAIANPLSLLHWLQSPKVLWEFDRHLLNCRLLYPRLFVRGRLEFTKLIFELLVFFHQLPLALACGFNFHYFTIFARASPAPWERQRVKKAGSVSVSSMSLSNILVPVASRPRSPLLFSDTIFQALRSASATCLNALILYEELLHKLLMCCVAHEICHLHRQAPAGISLAHPQVSLRVGFWDLGLVMCTKVS